MAALRIASGTIARRVATLTSDARLRGPGSRQALAPMRARIQAGTAGAPETAIIPSQTAAVSDHPAVVDTPPKYTSTFPHVRSNSFRSRVSCSQDRLRLQVLHGMARPWSAVPSD